jgi:hypothetical protein
LTACVEAKDVSPLKVRQLAKIAGVESDDVREWIADGRLAATCANGSRRFGIWPNALESFLRRQRRLSLGA